MKQLLLFVMMAFAADVQAQWTKLFNENNLDGWKPLNGSAPYVALNHEIVGTTVAGTANSFLVTEKTYGDFILELEFKLDGQSNSGIQVRSESSADYQNGRVHGYQIEIDPSARAWTGGLYDEGRREWLYPLEYNLAAKTAFKSGDTWNKMRIECIGPVIRAWVNGVPTCYVVDDMTPKGFIALQVHSVGKAEDAGQRVHWRNIVIQTEKLKPSPADNIFVANFLPNDLTDQEKKNGVRLLWDGKTSNGWRGALMDKFPEAGWEIRQGELQVVPAGDHGGDLVTQKEFAAFDLQFEFKFDKGGNSGVKYFVSEKSGSALGLEYQILDDDSHPDAIMGEGGNRRQASLYDLVPAIHEKRGIHKLGTWNQGRIIVYPDNHAEHWLNGYKVVEYQRGGPGFAALIAKSKYANYENFGIIPTGHILLQTHGSPVWFRSIKIKELK